MKIEEITTRLIAACEANDKTAMGVACIDLLLIFVTDVNRIANALEKKNDAG